MTIEQAADLGVKVLQVAIVPAVASAWKLLVSMRSELSDGIDTIRSDVARLDNRLVRQEEWRHAHDRQDDERHERHEDQIRELFHRTPSHDRPNGSASR